MSCLHPLLAVYTGDNDNGTKRIKILNRIDDVTSIEDAKLRYEKFGHKLFLLPCGQCLACKKNRKRQWSVRCQFEALEHKDNCFITLTYDDNHLPKKLIKRDYQLFFKALRNHGYQFRFFGCGEYSPKGRPHFHICLFGFIPDDLKPSHKSDSGFMQYTSNLISSCWKKGLCTVAEFSPETASYVAGYVDKKLNDDSFTFMSRKPGIGRAWIEKNIGKVYSYDSLVVNFGGHVMGIPRYFDKVAAEHDLYLEDIKEVRVQNALLSQARAFHDLECLTFEDLFSKKLSIEQLKAARIRRNLEV